MNQKRKKHRKVRWNLTWFLGSSMQHRWADTLLRQAQPFHLKIFLLYVRKL